MANQSPTDNEQTAEKVLAEIYEKANQPASSVALDPDILTKVMYICQNQGNRAGVRLLMACLLAKLLRPEIDVRKPYTEIGTPDSFSGRTYDEQYIAPFVQEHELPCNSTTAFLTPALRNRNTTLTPDLNLVGRPPQLYKNVLELLDDVYQGTITAGILLTETVRCLIQVRNEQKAKLRSLLVLLQDTSDVVPLSAEGIVQLIQSQMMLPRTSRLPVLIIAAIYQTISEQLNEKVLPLHSHNAADKQTKALGDLEIALVTDEDIIACYEVKDKLVTRLDIDNAVAKVTASANTPRKIDHYVFITTALIEHQVADYATTLYQQTGGIEFVILDCIGFLRHFLHLFHRFRLAFLEAYQELLLAEPESAVSAALKESFLAARRASEQGIRH